MALASGPALAEVAQQGPQQLAWLTQSLTTLLPGLACTLVVLALMHQRDRQHLLLAVAMLSWFALVSRGTWVNVQPEHEGTLELTLGALLAGALALGGVRQAGMRHLAADWVLPLQAMLLPILPLLPFALPHADIWRVSLWTLLAAELLVVACWLLWRRGAPMWRQGGSVRLGLEVVVLPALLLASVGLHALSRGWSGLQASQGLTSLLFAVLGGAVLRNFALARKRSEQQLAQMDKRMQERLQEVERQHKELSEQRLDQVTERERKRIAGDLHDDLGAKLLTIVHTSDNERISTLAREALEEMRLSVRGLTGKPVQLLDAIGDWRAEVVSRLSQANIEAEWLPMDEDVAFTLPARAYVQTTRIIRESISNAIKHSEATRCVVRCSVGDGDFQMVIQDNGRGIPIGIDGRLDRGHGMASMKSRAKQMQGQCLVESGPGWGTVIRLTIPL